MLVFEENIFYPQTHKIDFIKLSNVKLIHYKISSDRQNKYWFIAVTLEDNGKIIIQNQLSKICDNYGMVNTYISLLPKAIEGILERPTIDSQMRKDINHILELMQVAQNELKIFKEKYNV